MHAKVDSRAHTHTHTHTHSHKHTQTHTAPKFHIIRFQFLNAGHRETLC